MTTKELNTDKLCEALAEFFKKPMFQRHFLRIFYQPKNKDEVSYVKSIKKIADKLKIKYEINNVDVGIDKILNKEVPDMGDEYNGLVNTNRILITNKETSQKIAGIGDAFNVQDLDIDNIFYYNTGKFYDEHDGKMLMRKMRRLVPCTALAINQILFSYSNDNEIAIVGRSRNVGQPLEHLLQSKGKTTMLFNSKSDLSALKNFHTIVTATGHYGVLNKFFENLNDNKPRLIIDAGINFDNGHLVGDIDTSKIKNSLNITYTPVKHGVGQVTTYMVLSKLFYN